MAIASNDYSRLGQATRQFLDRDHGHFINGEWAKGGGGIAVLDPSSATVISAIAAGGAAQIDAAVTAAHQAFHGSAWRDLAPQQRERLIQRLADLIEANAQLLAELECVDNGMPLGFAGINVGGAAGVLRHMAGWASKIVGDTVDVKMPFPGSQFFAYTAREAVGVVGAIVPWNVPLMMAIWKLAPALAAGCTVVLKPAEDASLTALALADLIAQAGFAPGVVNIVTGLGSEAGEALVAHPLVSKISFTGSTATGKHINRLATDSLKKVTLELGGKSPTIVFDDADLQQAIVGAANAIFTNSGQICVAGARLYVQRGIFDEVVEGVARHADGLMLGAGLDPASQLGPLISARQQARVQGYVQRACAGGASLVTRRPAIASDGFFVAPAVLADVRQDDALVQEEIFGPVLAVLPFDDLDEAVALANDTPYGLAASVWSGSISRVHQLVPRLKCGKVSVNTEGFPHPALPEGGTKQSGFGRDLGRESLDAYLDTKTVLVRGVLSMPHFIVEYTANLDDDLQLQPLFERVHERLIGMALFPTGGIRSRARRIETYRFADGARDYAGVHVELKLSAARPAGLRREIGEAVFATVRDYLAPLQARRYLALSMAVGLFETPTFFNENNLHELFARAPA